MAFESSLPLSVALKRGFGRKCPNCGKGKLFSSFLKQVPQCDKCGEVLGNIRADDGPAWLTILVVGHLIIPFLVITQMRGFLSPLVGGILWMAIALALTFLLLERAKGIFIAILWRTRAPN